MKVIRAVKPNAGIQAAYRREMEKLIDDVNRSVLYWVRAGYRKQEPSIAMDSAAGVMGRILTKLFKYWVKRWGKRADNIAERFVNRSKKRTQNSYYQAFKAAGFTVKVDPSRFLNETSEALVAENVALIKSIPERYFGEVTELVQRCVSQGRHVKELENEIYKRYKVSRKRAKLIARDQTNKACFAIRRAEDMSLGITEGIWVHFPGTKYYRDTHRRMHGKRFKLSEGLYDSDVKRNVLPAELVNCCCTYRAIVPEFGDKYTSP